MIFICIFVLYYTRYSLITYNIGNRRIPSKIKKRIKALNLYFFFNREQQTQHKKQAYSSFQKITVRPVNSKIIFIFLLLIFSQINHSAFSEENSFYLLSPPRDGVIYKRKPSISLSFRNVAIRLKSVKVFVNNENVTESCIILPGFLSYKPSVDLPFGENLAKVQFTEKSGKKHLISWEFHIKRTNLIKSIYHDYKSPMMVKEILNVTMKGKPGGKAHFDIVGLRSNIPMNEISPGVYRGFYQIDRFDYTADTYILGKLRMSDGKYEDMKAKKKSLLWLRFLR